MKSLYLFVLICFVQQHCSRGDDTDAPDLSQLTVACIGIPELLRGTAIACTQQGNTTLWDQIIDCHRPITDEFLRESAEARCAVDLHVNPLDQCVSMQDVFLNICGITNAATEADKNRGLNCLLHGRPDACPKIMNHAEEVEAIKQFRETMACDIGQCIHNLNIGGFN